jgi:WD40 repeat protein
MMHPIERDWGEALLAGDVKALCWLTNNVLLASARGGRIFCFDVTSGSQSALIQQSNVDDEHKIREWSETGNSALVRLDDSTFVAGRDFGNVVAFDIGSPLVTGRKSNIVPLNGFNATRNRVLAAAFHSSSDQLAVGLVDHSIRVLDAKSLEQTRHFNGHTNSVVGLAWSPCGKKLASVSYDRTLRLWNLEDLKEEFPPIEHPMDAMSLSWGLNDDEIVTAWNRNGFGGSIRVWSANTGEQVAEFGESAAIIEAIAVSREAGLIATGGLDGYVRTFAPKHAGFSLSSEQAHSAPIWQAAQAAPQHELATLSADGVRIWSLETGRCKENLCRDWSEYLPWTKHLEYSNSGKRLAVVLGPNVNMFDAESRTLMWSNSFGNYDIQRCFFSMDGTRFLTDDGRAPNAFGVDAGYGCVVWNVENGSVIDRSEDDGLGAEYRLREYDGAVDKGEAAVNAFPESPRERSWASWMTQDGNSGDTIVRVSDLAGRTTELCLPGVVKHKFGLPDVGTWALIFQGATAPQTASILWP